MPQQGQLAGLTVNAWVNTTNQVTVRVTNNTGGTVTVPTSWTVEIIPAYNFPEVV